MDPESNALRSPFLVPQFRALIIGRANAGKTTVLRYIAQSADGRVDPSTERGSHDIKHELVFKSNKGFVFHDSCGIEAETTNEIDTIFDFIRRRNNALSLAEKLHAIWFERFCDHPKTFNEVFPTLHRPYFAKYPVYAPNISDKTLRILCLIACLAIGAEHSFWLKGDKFPENVKKATKVYLKSRTLRAVTREIQVAFQDKLSTLSLNEHYETQILSPLCEIITTHLLPHEI